VLPDNRGGGAQLGGAGHRVATAKACSEVELGYHGEHHTITVINVRRSAMTTALWAPASGTTSRRAASGRVGLKGVGQ
jgi:hypothetical protein